QWPIYTYDAKWQEGSSEYVSAPLKTGVELPPGVMEQFADLTARVYRLFGCRDYARIDLRLTADNRPFGVEMNPNPFLNNVALEDGLKAHGRRHEQFVADLVRRAAARGGAPQA